VIKNTFYVTAKIKIECLMKTKIIPHQKAGSFILFFVQIFSTMSFSILYSTLVLYITNGLKLNDMFATTLTATFVAFNYVLHLLGGIITGKLFSHRSLFAIGMVLQAFGAYILSLGNLYLGLAIFLTGAGINVTCINCILTQFYDPHDKKREKAFLWNYSGMNIGFLVGFSISGIFEKLQDYNTLFQIGALSNILAFLIIISFYKYLKDINTYFSLQKRLNKNILRLLGSLILIGVIISLLFLLKFSNFSNSLIIFIGILMVFVIIFVALKQKSIISKEKYFAFLILTFMAVIFWTLYMTLPMGLTLFIEHNVNRVFFHVLIEPQWALNINTIIIIIGGPLMAIMYKHLRLKGFKITIPIQFTLALFLIGLGFVILGTSTNFADKNGFISFKWILLSYLLLSIGELCISPIGYAMIGQLIPSKHQGTMMGTWLMTSGIAAVFANMFSKIAINNEKSDPLVTNPLFAKMFYLLGISTIFAGMILLILVPFLHNMIKEKKSVEESSLPR